MSEIQNQGTDLLTRFKNNELDLDSLSPIETDQLAKQLESLETGIESEEETMSAEKRVTEDKEDKSYTQQSNVDPKEKKSLKDKYVEKADEANRYYQLHQTNIEKQNKHERLLKTDPSYRKRYFESLGIPLPEIEAQKTQQSFVKSSKDIENKLDEDEDIYSEEYLRKVKKLEQETREMRDELNRLKGVKEQENLFQQEEDRLKQELMQIEDLQREYAALKTSKPFKQLDSEYAQWYNSLGTENVSRYFSDPEYKAQLDKAGRGLFEEFDKYETLVKTHEKYKNGKYPTIRSAFRDSEYLDKMTLKQSSPSYYDATEDVARRMSQIDKEPKVMGATSSEESFQSEGMTDQFMNNWLSQNPNPEFYTKQQMEIFEKIGQKLGMK